ncbi:MerR family transcriptional regulator [Streptosporangium sp. CA-135522]|uniref:MerR family transcriptional regulator n=1 Tax=Streptosporangium sp. CA-135522 TaxID=3240072 RepID=UPI003D8EFF43
MKIGDLARETGVSPRLLRYYEEQGLLHSHRSDGGHRRYADDAPVTVLRIRTLLAAGLPTGVIREILPCVEGPALELHQCVLSLLHKQLGDIESRISELQHAHTALATLIGTTERHHIAA